MTRNNKTKQKSKAKVHAFSHSQKANGSNQRLFFTKCKNAVTTIKRKDKETGLYIVRKKPLKVALRNKSVTCGNCEKNLDKFFVVIFKRLKKFALGR